MAALVLTAPQAALVAALEAALDSALKDGVNDSGGNQLLPPMDGYESVAMTKDSKKLQIMTKSIFKSILASLVSVLPP